MLLYLAAVAAQAAPAPVPPRDPYADAKAIIAGLQRIVTPNGVQEQYEVTLGGARQVVTVRGADRGNPILLFIHGGPGAAETSWAWTFQRPWEDVFTVVQWDQRGAGKSYRLNDPAALAPTLKPERYVDDAIELIEQLRKRYGKRKVFVLGHSWGSFVGLSVASKRPDLLYAYIGVGQTIEPRENEKIVFDWTLAKARAEKNAEAIRELEALEPYPGPAPLTIERTDAQRKWGIRYGALAAYHDSADYYFRLPRLSPDYTAEDRAAMDPGSLLTVQNIWPAFTALSLKPITRMRVPVLMFLGRHDYTTPAEPAAAWMRRLDAPLKRTIWFEHSAHLAFLEEPGNFFTALVTEALPLAKDDRLP